MEKLNHLGQIGDSAVHLLNGSQSWQML